MALTPSTMLELGTKAPDFSLLDVNTNKTVTLSDFQACPALLVMFICNHCPYVKHVREGLALLTSEYLGRGVGIVGISSNDVATHPADGPREMAQEAIQAGYRFPYLFDETQKVAHAYHAACTPDFFLFDGQQRLVYRGQMDDSGLATESLSQEKIFEQQWKRSWPINLSAKINGPASDATSNGEQATSQATSRRNDDRLRNGSQDLFPGAREPVDLCSASLLRHRHQHLAGTIGIPATQRNPRVIPKR